MILPDGLKLRESVQYSCTPSSTNHVFLLFLIKMLRVKGSTLLLRTILEQKLTVCHQQLTPSRIMLEITQVEQKHMKQMYLRGMSTQQWILRWLPTSLLQGGDTRFSRCCKPRQSRHKYFTLYRSLFYSSFWYHISTTSWGSFQDVTFQFMQECCVRLLLLQYKSLKLKCPKQYKFMI